MATQKTYTSDLIYNKVANDYGFDIKRQFSSSLKYDVITKHLNKNDNVLDAGCANGLFAFALSPHCNNIVGIDICQEFLKIADIEKEKNQLQNVSFQFNDISALSFPDNEFDVTYSLSTILLVENWQKGIAECSRVTKKGGYIILDIAGYYNLCHPFWKNWYRKNGHSHFNAFKWSQVRSLESQFNLEIIEYHALGLLDQWKCLPVITHYASKLSFIDKVIHPTPSFDLDYMLTNNILCRGLASRWYVVFKKP